MAVEFSTPDERRAEPRTPMLSEGVVTNIVKYRFAGRGVEDLLGKIRADLGRLDADPEVKPLLDRDTEGTVPWNELFKEDGEGLGKELRSRLVAVLEQQQANGVDILPQASSRLDAPIEIDGGELEEVV